MRSFSRSVFCSTGKCRPEKTQYLDAFHAVLVKRNNMLNNPQFHEGWFALLQIFRAIKLLSILSVLKFFVLPKDICEKTNFFKILKDRHLLVDGCCTNIIFRLCLGIEVHFTKNANSLL